MKCSAVGAVLRREIADNKGLPSGLFQWKAYGMRVPKSGVGGKFVFALLAFAGSAAFCFGAPAAKHAAPVFGGGDLVRLVRKETLQFRGEPFLAAPKGQEFSVFKHEPGKGVVFLAFVQKEGEVIAVTLPEDALELVPPDGWAFLLKGSQAFREQRFDDSKRLLAKASQDVSYRELAASVLARIDALANSAVQVLQVDGDQSLKAAPELFVQKQAAVQKNFLDAVTNAREMSLALYSRGFSSLAFAVDEGTERLAARVRAGKTGDAPKPEIPPARVPREELSAKARQAAFAVVRCRQAMAVRRMVEASSYIDEGLRAEPARPELKAMQSKVQEEIRDAEDRYNAAQSNRKRNLPQALLALERGLKTCADLPALLSLREELSGALEEKTAPPVTPAFLSAAKTSTAAAVLEQGRTLYVSRCNQCHDLEMLDSRSPSAWKSEVSSMARRAKIDDAQQSLIMQYLTAAHVVAGEAPVRKTD